MHVCLVVDDDTIADHLVSALENGGRHRFPFSTILRTYSKAISRPTPS